MHLEVLNTKERREIFSKLFHFKDFYLVGGTALALQIGHRISVDFDLFSDKPLSPRLLSQVKKIFSGYKIKVEADNPEEFTVYVGKTKINFVCYPFPLLFKKVRFKKLNMLGIKEIGVSKAYTIGRRASYRDYIDLYFVVFKKYTGLLEIVKLAKKKYKNEFNPKLFLEQLVFFKDIKSAKIRFLGARVSFKELERFFIKQVENIKEDLI